MKLLKQNLRLFLKVLCFYALVTGCTKNPVAVIYIDYDADKSEELAAREIRKYIYQRTGELVPVTIWNDEERINGDAIFVGSMKTGMMKSSGYSFPETGSGCIYFKNYCLCRWQKASCQRRKRYQYSLCCLSSGRTNGSRILP